MKMDQLFQKRGLHTSIGGKLKEMMLTISLSLIPLFVLVVYVGSLMAVSTIVVFSWSWTDETAQPHHHLFLLPFAPFLVSVLPQFLLFRKYVRPSSASELSFAFLSVIIPVRIYLIKDQGKAFKYYILSHANIWSSAILSFLTLLAVMYNLPPSEDKDHHLFILTLEVFFPLFLWGIHLMATSSLFLWHFVILPNLSSPHSFPDYQDLSRRLPSFPSYWPFHTNNLILQERLKTRANNENCDSEVSIEEWTLLQKVLKKRKQDTQQSLTIPKPIEEVLQEEDQGDCSRVDSICDTESKTKENLLRNPKKTKLMAEILEKSNPIDFANAGFFYSHPRMQGLQVAVIFWIL